MIGFREIKMLAERVFRALQPEIRTHLIGQVVSYDATVNTAEIQPVVNALRFRDGENLTTKQLPVLKDVPVQLTGSGKVWCTYAPAVGTYGILHIQDREIETWLTTGGIVDPALIHLHDLSDATFEPSVFPLVDDGDNALLTEVVETDRICLRTRTNLTQIAVKDDETININVNDGVATVTVDVDGNIAITSDGTLSATTEGDITVESTGGAVAVTADGDVDVTAGGALTIESTGGAVAITADGDVDVTAGGEVNIDGSSGVNVTGAFDANGNLTVDA